VRDVLAGFGGAAVSVVEIEPIVGNWIDDEGRQHTPMSREEYLAQPEGRPWFEWCRGEAIEMIYANPEHQRAVLQIARILADRFDERGLDVIPSLALDMGQSIRIPDVAIVPRLPLGVVRVTAPPLVVVEVLSPSTRQTDLIDKAGEYADFGVGQYWIVDVEAPSVAIQQNVNGIWHPTATLTRDNPTAEVEIPDCGIVALDITKIIRAD